MRNTFNETRVFFIIIIVISKNPLLSLLSLVWNTREKHDGSRNHPCNIAEVRSEIIGMRPLSLAVINDGQVS